MNWKPEPLAQVVGETGHFLRLSTRFAAHAQGIAHHYFGDVILPEKMGQRLKIEPLVLTAECGQALRRNAEGIRNRQADSLCADVEAQDSSGWILLVLGRHPAIICRAERSNFRYDMPMDSGTVPAREASPVSPPQPTRSRNPAQMIIAAGVILYFCNQAEPVLAVLLVSLLLAFILTPVVELVQRWRLPRSVASLIAVMLLLAVGVGVTYLSYNQAASFVHNLPRYSGKIREEIARLRQSAENWETGETSPPSTGVLTVRTGTNWTELLTRGFGSVSQALFAASFVPFLVYFMLSWQHHARSATVMLFRMENRHTAYVTLGLIAKMMRSFMVGNLLVGLFMSAVSALVFGLMHLPFFYFVGPLSGFLSLVPYLGVPLALTPPLLVGIEQIQSGDVIVIVLTVLALHLFSLNVLYPKFLGNRLQLNPLAVTISLLFWGWLWGAMGLVLAIPLTAATKIVFDHIEPLRPYGAWLGE